MNEKFGFNPVASRLSIGRGMHHLVLVGYESNGQAENAGEMMTVN